jgi:hypothetical protein
MLDLERLIVEGRGGVPILSAKAAM